MWVSQIMTSMDLEKLQLAKAFGGSGVMKIICPLGYLKMVFDSETRNECGIN